MNNNMFNLLIAESIEKNSLEQLKHIRNAQVKNPLRDELVFVSLAESAPLALIEQWTHFIQQEKKQPFHWADHQLGSALVACLKNPNPDAEVSLYFLNNPKTNPLTFNQQALQFATHHNHMCLELLYDKIKKEPLGRLNEPTIRGLIQQCSHSVPKSLLLKELREQGNPSFSSFVLEQSIVLKQFHLAEACLPFLQDTTDISACIVRAAEQYETQTLLQTLLMRASDEHYEKAKRKCLSDYGSNSYKTLVQTKNIVENIKDTHQHLTTALQDLEGNKSAASLRRKI